MNSFKQPGDVLELPAPYARESGEGAKIGSIFGVATKKLAAGEVGNFMVSGVHELKKTSAQAWTVGEKIYWDDVAKEATTTAGSNIQIGVATAAAQNPSATGLVRLSGAFTI